MAGMRDDSAGDYGQWINPQDQSWLDYLKMKGSDVGGGAYNALANITGALSPVGTSPEGNMSLQVPPMVTGLVDSAKRIGQRGGFTRVPELDEQLKQDLSNVVLSLYGGNALAGLTKPRGALGAGAMREAGDSALNDLLTQTFSRKEFDSKFSHGGKEYTANGYIDPDGTANVDWIGLAYEPGLKRNTFIDGPNTLPRSALKSWRDQFTAEHPEVKSFVGERISGARNKNGSDPVQKIDALFSDTGKPNILGSALATAGEQRLPMDHASRMARAKEMGFDTETPVYRGIRKPYSEDEAAKMYYQMFTSSPREASEYGSNVIEAYLKRGRNLSVDAGGRNFNEVPTDGLEFTGLGPYARTDEIAHKAKAAGYDSVTFNNIFDNATDVKGYAPKPTPRPSRISDEELLAELGITPEDLEAAQTQSIADVQAPIQPWERRPTTVEAIFDPRNIRSVNAAFDPAKADSANLLYSRGVPLPPQQQDDNLPPWLKF